jgi:hypothetical protein
MSELPSKQDIHTWLETHQFFIQSTLFNCSSSSSSSSSSKQITNVQIEVTHLFMIYITHRLQCMLLPYWKVRDCFSDNMLKNSNLLTEQQQQQPTYRALQYRRTLDPDLQTLVQTILLGMAIPSILLYFTVLVQVSVLLLTASQKRIKIE